MAAPSCRPPTSGLPPAGVLLAAAVLAAAAAAVDSSKEEACPAPATPYTDLTEPVEEDASLLQTRGPPRAAAAAAVQGAGHQRLPRAAAAAAASTAEAAARRPDAAEGFGAGAGSGAGVVRPPPTRESKEDQSAGPPPDSPAGGSGLLPKVLPARTTFLMDSARSLAPSPQELLVMWQAWWRLPAAALVLVVAGLAALCAFIRLVAYRGNGSSDPLQLWQSRLMGSLCLEPHSLPDPASFKLGAPKLPGAKASFAAPLSCLEEWRANTLSVDIPVAPDVCRLHVVLTRSRVGGSGAWGEIRLSAAPRASAFAAQPLLTCRPLRRGPAKACPLAEQRPEVGAQERGKPGDVEVCNSDGMTGCIRSLGGSKYAFRQEKKGRSTFNKEETLAYQIEAHTEYNWISVAREDGKQVALASRHMSEKVAAEYLQVDVEPGTDSPESALLLMCVLALVAFSPS